MLGGPEVVLVEITHSIYTFTFTHTHTHIVNVSQPFNSTPKRSHTKTFHRLQPRRRPKNICCCQCGNPPAVWFLVASRFRSAPTPATSPLTETARMVASTATARCALIASTAAPNLRGLRFSHHLLGLRRRRLKSHRRQRLQCRESSRS